MFIVGWKRKLQLLLLLPKEIHSCFRLWELEGGGGLLVWCGVMSRRSWPLLRAIIQSVVVQELGFVATVCIPYSILI